MASISSATETPPLESQNDASTGNGGFRPRHLSRAGSVYSLSRVSFSSQLSQLTSIQLPDPDDLAESMSAIMEAPTAAKALDDAATQIQAWIQKAMDVLEGLDAGDDSEWAAAAGREGLVEVDEAINKFETLIQVFIVAVEKLQLREDVAKIGDVEMRRLVKQLEKIAKEWTAIKSHLRKIKLQVELALELQELQVAVFEKISNDLEALSQQVFEMEERRHHSGSEAIDLTEGKIDVAELELMVEKSPDSKLHGVAGTKGSSPPIAHQHDIARHDGTLLGLFARLQPLKASVEFLPMQIAGIQHQARDIFPSTCDEMDHRTKGLQDQLKEVEADADSLRRELGEDRWTSVFKSAGRKALKMIDSVERSITSLDESLDSNTSLRHAPGTMRNIKRYEEKKMHYSPAIEQILRLVEQGVKNRLTVNGEILRLQTDLQARWRSTVMDIRNMDSTLESFESLQTQDLRDSVSSMMSSDRSLFSTAVDTPGDSSTSSSLVNSRRQSQSRSGARTPSFSNGKTRSERSGSQSTATRPDFVHSRDSSISKIPIRTPVTRSSAHGSSLTPSHSPQTPRSTSSTASSARRATGRSTPSTGERPRWNASTRVRESELDRRIQTSVTSDPSPSPHHKTSTPQRASSALKQITPSSARSSMMSYTSPLSRRTSGGNLSNLSRQSSMSPTMNRPGALLTPTSAKHGTPGTSRPTSALNSVNSKRNSVQPPAVQTKARPSPSTPSKMSATYTGKSANTLTPIKTPRT